RAEKRAPVHREPASRVAATASRVDARGAELVGLACGAPPKLDLAERVRIERARSDFFLDPRAPAGPFTGRAELARESDRARLVAAIGGHAPDRAFAVTAIDKAAGCAFAGF